MRVVICFIATTLTLGGVAGGQEFESALLKAREGFDTALTRKVRETETLEAPPPDQFSIVQYDGPLGKMSAYLSRPKKPGKQVPAIIWITGGFPPGSAGSYVWGDPPMARTNDQSAMAYRQAGMVMMYPALRGCGNNPGHQESFFGEVDDILAAAEFLASQDFVDPRRVYLGGHSTGGTLALLVAAATDRFRAVFAFGAVTDPLAYGQDRLTYDAEHEQERRLRAPYHFLESIPRPTFIIEGDRENKDETATLCYGSDRNPKVHCFQIAHGNHFDILGPLNQYIASQIATLEVGQRGTLSERALEKAFLDDFYERLKQLDLARLEQLRAEGVDLNKSVRVRHHLSSMTNSGLFLLKKELDRDAFVDMKPIEKTTDKNGDELYRSSYTVQLNLSDKEAVFQARRIGSFAPNLTISHDGWEIIGESSSIDRPR